MENLLTLVDDVATNAAQTAVAIGPSATSDPAKQFYPGQTAVLHIVPTGDYDGTVDVDGSDDGGTTYDQVMLNAFDASTGKGKMVQMTVHEHMQVTTASRTAGSVSVYLTKGS